LHLPLETLTLFTVCLWLVIKVNGWWWWWSKQGYVCIKTTKQFLK